ncbi:MAG: TerB family tellurite resistance protein [Bacteroidota bacterium]
MAGFAKWIGGSLGWAFGGPIGGILGFVFGSMLDGATVTTSQSIATTSGDFSVSLLVLSAAIMKADGKVMKSELDFVKRFFVQSFGEAQAAEKMKLLREILKQDIPINDVCLQIKQFMEYSSRLQLLHYLFGLSAADNQYHKSELDLIQSIANLLGIRLADFTSIKAMFVPDIDNAYKILEITPDATDDEIKKAYRRMAVKYHPDKVGHLGEDVQNAAKEKFQQLNNAFTDLKKQRGIV